MKRTSPGSLASRLLFLPACALLALIVLAPTVEAVPLTLTIDNPNQIVAAPTSGSTILTFSGTITLDPNFRLTSASFDNPFNSSLSSFLSGTFTSDFFNFFVNSGTGTYTGSLFSLTVPAGTPVDLYAFAFPGGGASMFSLEAQFVGDAVFGGISQVMANQAFSVQVTGGTGVPDGGSSVMLLGLSLTVLGFGRRVFTPRERE